MSKSIYKYYEHFGRCGTLEGIFLATKEDVDNAIGKDVYLGEVLGKHSEVETTLDDKCILLVTSDPNIVDIFERFNMSTGINPIQILSEVESDE